MMALLTTLVDVAARSGTALPNYPTWPLEALSLESTLADVYPEDIVAWVQPGRIALADSPVSEGDSAHNTRAWTTVDTDFVRVQDTELGGLNRWSGDGVASGLKANLDAALTDYSIALLVKPVDVSGFKFAFSVGPTAGTRLVVYITGDEVAVQHGSGDIHQTSTSPVAGDTWLAILVSFQDSSNALRIYTSSTTPDLSATTANNPPANVAAAIGSGVANSNPFAGEIALVAVWDRALHLDAAATETVVTALNGFLAL